MKNSQNNSLNYFQLSCILGSALGLPAMTIGGQLLKKYDAGIAIAAVFIGNIILWVIGLAIAAMAKKTKNAIENVKSYLGKYAGFISSIIWIFTFLFWYSLQVQGAAEVITDIFPSFNILIIGISVGLLTSFLSIWNIKIIKLFYVVAFIFLFIMTSYNLITSGTSIPIHITLSFVNDNSTAFFEAVISVIIIWLPFSVNLPTLTRHASSKADTALAISLKTGLLIFFELSTIFLNADTSSVLVNRLMPFSSEIKTAIVLLFVLSSYTCVNLLNIYFANAGWDIIFSRYKSKWRYCGIGALGTFVYFIIQKFDADFSSSNSLLIAEMLLTSFIINLGIVLLLDILVRLCVKNVHINYQRMMSTFCWGIGCLTTIYLSISSKSNSNEIYYNSALVCCLTFLIIAFISQSLVSFKHIMNKDQKTIRQKN